MFDGLSAELDSWGQASAEFIEALEADLRDHPTIKACGLVTESTGHFWLEASQIFW